MKKLTPEQIGLDFEALLALIGKERVLDLINEEQVLENLLRRQGEQWLREQLERRTQSSEAEEPEIS
ncbi:MAG: hypothetical protein ETSY1_27400 [Candidatus Entotheonella factor]|uniref:Uncharacterized protein n=1 Tax=Entotheonella factor TaxID=1429438 RepID=W4LFW6_ENTF1|nr:MAG: hypothetical protein ETSY1_27400 [Candidatus Entotheonella factor]